jgi:hypothetical protein
MTTGSKAMICLLKECKVGDRIQFEEDGQTYQATVLAHDDCLTLLGWKKNEVPYKRTWVIADMMFDAVLKTACQGYDLGYWFSSTKQEVQVLATRLVINRPVSAGMSCKVCRDFNNYAEPNMADASYLCYRCRKGSYETIC